MTRSEDSAAALRETGAAAAVVDVFDGDALSAAMNDARPEVVVHQLTAIPEDLDPRKMEEQFEATNRVRTEGTGNLLAAARACGAGRFISQSIAFAYAPREGGLHGEDDPLWAEATPIFAAVQEMEGLVLGAEGLEGLVLRYGFFYGPGTSYTPDGGTGAAVRKRQFPVMGRGQGEWPFIHIDDAASATVAAVERGGPGVYNVVDDDPAPLREWLPVYAKAIGARAPRRVPAWLARLFAGAMVARMASAVRGASNAKARAELGWQPAIPSWREGFTTALDGAPSGLRGQTPQSGSATTERSRAMSIRRRTSDWRMMREICIWETPMRVEISVCVRSSAKRRRRTSRSRAERTSIAPSSRTRISVRCISGSSAPIASARLMSRSSPVGSSSERMRRAPTDCSVCSTSSNGASIASASSCTVGERPFCDVSLSRALASLSCISCIPRGTRIAHVRSRKWRLISPSTVGVA